MTSASVASDRTRGERAGSAECRRVPRSERAPDPRTRRRTGPRLALLRRERVRGPPPRLCGRRSRHRPGERRTRRTLVPRFRREPRRPPTRSRHRTAHSTPVTRTCSSGWRSRPPSWRRSHARCGACSAPADSASTPAGTRAIPTSAAASTAARTSGRATALSCISSIAKVERLAHGYELLAIEELRRASCRAISSVLSCGSRDPASPPGASVPRGAGFTLVFTLIRPLRSARHTGCTLHRTRPRPPERSRRTGNSTS